MFRLQSFCIVQHLPRLSFAWLPVLHAQIFAMRKVVVKDLHLQMSTDEQR